MASIHKDPRNKSPFWYCAYTLPDGRRAFRSTKQRDRKKASDICRMLEKASEKARAGELSEVQVRKLLDEVLESVGQPPMQSESVRSFFANWLSGKQLAITKGTHTHYKKVLERFLEGLGERAEKSLANVRPGDVASFRDARLKIDGISIGTLLLELKAIRSVFSTARRHGLILHNPAEAVDMPTDKPLSREVFTPEEVRAILDVASEEWRTLILFGYYLGGRLKDLATLSWEAIDLASGIVFYTQGKTGQKVEVPIHQDLEDRLLSIAGDNPRGLLCPKLAKMSPDGRNGLSNQFARLMVKAGVDQRKVQSGRNWFSRKSFHSLRHSFSSALANAGISADVRMKLTGHRSVDVHQRYTHMQLEPLKQAIATLPNLRVDGSEK
jgi:integrase